MGSEWRNCTLADLAVKEYGMVDGPFGSNLPAASYVHFGVPVIRGSNLTLGSDKFKQHEFVYVSQSKYEELSRSGCVADDIVFTKKGTLGQTGMVPGDSPHRNYLLSSNQMRLRVDKAMVFPSFVYDYVSSIESVTKIIRDSESTDVPEINLEYLRKFPIKLPSIGVQQAIAHILGTLDDKIELNRQTNQTLEAMAQALFKSWFVDFDPVIDNALAAGNEIPEPLKARAVARQALDDARKSLPEEIRGGFPDGFEFVDEMGWVPRGWGVEAVYDIATFVNGASFKSEDFATDENGLPVVKIAEVKNGISGRTKFCGSKKDEKYLIADGEILFSWSGNPQTSIDTFVWFNGKGWLNQHIFKVVTDKGRSKSFVYNLLKHLKPIFTATASNKQTTGLGHVTVKDLRRLQAVKPPAAIDAHCETQLGAIGSRVHSNQLQSISLITLRDTLLPKLLSDQLTIPDAEKLVADAL